jgi:hypothetical protein
MSLTKILKKLKWVTNFFFTTGGSKMRKRFSLIMGVIFLIICTGRAFCLSVSLIPDCQTIDMGDMAVFDLNVSGLGNEASPSIGAFSLNVFYDQNLLDFKLQSVVFSDYLGFSNQFVSLLPGQAWLGEVSFETPADLNNLQPPDFTAISFAFLALNAGDTFVDFDPVILSDENGFVSAELTFSNHVTVASAPIPEPATILLLTTGLAGLGVLGRKKLRSS